MNNNYYWEHVSLFFCQLLSIYDCVLIGCRLPLKIFSKKHCFSFELIAKLFKWYIDQSEVIFMYTAANFL